MTEPLESAKAARNAAHRALQTRLAQIQADLEARSVGGRLADRAGEVVANAAEVANEHKGVVAGTITALAAWFLRGPIIRLVGHFWPGEHDTERKP